MKIKTLYRIEGKADGIDYGVYPGTDEVDAVRAMLVDAGSDDEPQMDQWIVHQEVSDTIEDY